MEVYRWSTGWSFNFSPVHSASLSTYKTFNFSASIWDKAKILSVILSLITSESVSKKRYKSKCYWARGMVLPKFQENWELTEKRSHCGGVGQISKTNQGQDDRLCCLLQQTHKLLELWRRKLVDSWGKPQSVSTSQNGTETKESK